MTQRRWVAWHRDPQGGRFEVVESRDDHRELLEAIRPVLSAPGEWQMLPAGVLPDTLAAHDQPAARRSRAMGRASALLPFLASPARSAEVALAAGIPCGRAKCYLSMLARAGLVRRVSWGPHTKWVRTGEG